MSSGFVHSVKVPRLYKVVARTVQSVEEEDASLKQLIYAKKHPNLLGTYALASTTIQHGPELDRLLRKTQLLIKEPRLDPWMARVLITELLWGKKCLASEAKPVKTILSYEKALLKELENGDKTADESVANRIRVKKLRYVRINTLVQTVDDAIGCFTDDGWTLLPRSKKYSDYLKTIKNLDENTFIQDYHVSELFVFPSGTHFWDHPGYKSGAIVLQDKASCLPAHLLNAPPGSTVLDMCAAPGMKTTHLAAIMENKGKIIATELDSRRYKTLCEMIERYFASCVTTLNLDALKLNAEQNPDIEYILVDPSCSGSGMLDRMTLGRSDSKCAPGRLVSLQSFQVLLLRHALVNFPKVKRVVYSTCSMFPEENEMVVDEILEIVGKSYNLVPVKTLIGSDWKNFSSVDYKCGDHCLYARPDVDLCTGFFVAIFERNFEVPLPVIKRKIFAEKRKNGDELETENDGVKSECEVGGKKRRRSRSKGKSTTTKIDDESTVVENGTVGEEQTRVNGKKRKSRIEEPEAVANDAVDENEPPKKHKKKKRGETEPEIVCIDEQVEVLMEKKKKKKKKKDFNVEEDKVEGAMTVDESTVVENKEKKKKKKKKEKECDIEILEVSPPVETSEQEIPKKKKKKKKEKQSEVEILEVSPTVEESVEDLPKKKKKKKTKDNEQS